MKLTNVLLLLFFVLSCFTAMGFSLGEDKKTEIVKGLAAVTKIEGVSTLRENVGKTLTGKDFNKLYPGTFLKLMTSDENNKGLQYHDGECVDTKSFCTSGSCRSELYFTDILRIQNDYRNGNYDHFRIITIPDTTQVRIGEGAFRADRICLGDAGTTSSIDDLKSDIRELITAKFRKLSKGGKLSNIDFYFANLDNADLRNAHLHHVDLHHVDLQYADLRSADLSNANLRGADLPGADLRGADLHDADLTAASIYDAADLRGADLQYAILHGANFQYADIRGANLYNAYLNGAHLEHADFRGANLRGADLNGAHLKHADFRGADLRGAHLEGTQDADLSGACLRNGFFTPLAVTTLRRR